MSTDDQLDLEFAYTTYQDSCRDIYSPALAFSHPTCVCGDWAQRVGGNRGEGATMRP